MYLFQQQVDRSISSVKMQGMHEPGHPVHHAGTLVDGHRLSQRLAADGDTGDQRRHGDGDEDGGGAQVPLQSRTTITAVVVPLTMPQMSPTTSLQKELT